MRRRIVSLLGLMLVVTAAIAFSQTPRTYSLTMKMGAGTTITTNRDGSSESVEQVVPPSKNGPGMHLRLLYDLEAHKLWTINLEGGPCTVVTYSSPEVPSAFDPIGSASETRAEVARQKLTALGSETVNGIAAKVYEVPIPEIKGKMRIFLEEKQNFPLREVYVFGDGKEQTAMEIASLSYARPPAHLFVPPQNCEELAGETNATGGHAEMKVEQAAAAEQKTGSPTPAREKAAAGRAPGAAVPARPQAAPVAEVTEVRAIGVQPSHYTAAAPAAYEFAFSVKASGPIEADWVLVSQADTAWASGKLVFDAAGSKELKIPVKIGVGNGQHWEGSGHLEVVVGGKRVSSEKVPVSADCRVK